MVLVINVFVCDREVAISRIVHGGGGYALWSWVTGVSVEPEVFLIRDGGICMSVEVSDVGLGAGDGGSKEEMSSSECEVLLVFTREG